MSVIQPIAKDTKNSSDINAATASTVTTSTSMSISTVANIASASTITSNNVTSNPETFSLIKAFNEETIQRYREMQEARKARAAKKQSQSKDNSEANISRADTEELRFQKVKVIVEKSPEKFPKLKKFMEDQEKSSTESQNPPTLKLTRKDCGLLEHALFYAIAIQDLDLIDELYKLRIEHQINIDTNCIISIPSRPTNAYPIRSVSPLFYTLVDNPLSGEDLQHYLDWEERESVSLKRAQIIQKLIMMGARIDEPMLFGIYYRTFLHLLTVKALGYKPLREVLLNILRDAKGFGLDLRITNYYNEQLLGEAIRTIENFDYKEITVDIIQGHKNIINELIRSNRFNYTLITNKNAKLLDFLILIRITNANPNLIETADIILEDMAQQSLEHVSTLSHRNYRDIEAELIKHAKTYSHNNDYYQLYGKVCNLAIIQSLGPHPNDEDGLSDQDIKDDDDRVELAVKELIVSKAMRIVKAQYSLGYAFEDYRHHLLVAGANDKPATSKAIKSNSQTKSPLWDIVLDYCYDNLSFFGDAYELRLQVRFPNVENSEQLYLFMNSSQNVPFSFDYVTKMIESCPDFDRNRTQPFQIDEPNNFNFYPWTPSAAQQMAILNGSAAAKNPKSTQEPSASIAATVTTSSSTTYTRPSGTQANTLATVSSSPSIGITDFSVRYYQYSMVDNFNDNEINTLTNYQLIVQPSLQTGNTIIRYFKDGQPIPICMYLTSGSFKYDSNSNPNNNPIYLQLGWKSPKLLVYWRDIQLISKTRITTFEKLAKELSDKGVDSINSSYTPPSRTSLLLSSDAQSATRLIARSSAAASATTLSSSARGQCHNRLFNFLKQNWPF